MAGNETRMDFVELSAGDRILPDRAGGREVEFRLRLTSVVPVAAIEGLALLSGMEHWPSELPHRCGGESSARHGRAGRSGEGNLHTQAERGSQASIARFRRALMLRRRDDVPGLHEYPCNVDVFARHLLEWNKHDSPEGTNATADASGKQPSTYRLLRRYRSRP
jgi:hypothetical protein